MDIDITGSADNTRVKAFTNTQQKNAGIAPSVNNAVLNNAAIPKYMDDLRKEAVAEQPSAEPASASQPSPQPSPQPSSSRGPETSQRPAPEAPQSQVTVTVTEKPVVVSTVITVMVSKLPTRPTTIVTVPRSTITVVNKTVTMTMESADPSADPATPKQKRSRILGGARNRH